MKCGCGSRFEDLEDGSSRDRHLVDVREKSAYSGSGNTGKIIVEVVIGGRHCSCALSKDGDLSWFVISTMAENEGPVDIPCEDLRQTMRCSSAPIQEQHVDHAGRG